MSSKEKKGPKKRSGKKKKSIKRTQPDSESDKGVGIPKHKHCNNCGVSVPPGEEFCSDVCRMEFDRMVKRKRKWMWLPFVITAALILLIIMLGGF